MRGLCSLGTVPCYACSAGVSPGPLAPPLTSSEWAVGSHQIWCHRAAKGFFLPFGIDVQAELSYGPEPSCPTSPTDHLAICHSSFWKPYEGRPGESPLISRLHRHIPLLPGYPSATRLHIAYEIISFNEDPKKSFQKSNDRLVNFISQLQKDTFSSL